MTRDLSRRPNEALRVAWLEALRRRDNSPQDDALDEAEQRAYDAYVDHCTEHDIEPLTTASG